MFEPRWDEKEFQIAMESARNSLEQQKASPGSIAGLEFNKLIYGSDHILSNNITGTEESLDKIILQDLVDYYESYFSPDATVLNFVGAMNQESLISSLGSISERWKSKEVSIPEYVMNDAPDNSEIYFYDMPGAKQSIIYIGYPCMSVNDPDFFPDRDPVFWTYLLSARF